MGEELREPKHPYNKALQRSIPAMQPKGEELYTIPGLPPDLSKPIPGCPFAPRCLFTRAECSEPVHLETVSPGHESACTRVQQGSLQLKEQAPETMAAARIDAAFTDLHAATLAEPNSAEYRPDAETATN